MRGASCTLSTTNLLHNLNVIESRAPGAKIMAMIKANAYGHGIRSVGQRLDDHVDALGVASVGEAVALREAGIKAPVVLIQGVFTPDEIAIAAAMNFHMICHSAHQV